MSDNRTFVQYKSSVKIHVKALKESFITKICTLNQGIYTIKTKGYL